MSKQYEDYIWKNGKPYGIRETSLPGYNHFKIIADPYYKRISIEQYADHAFVGVIYDSGIFDFRHLKPADQNAWQKTTIQDDGVKTICHIRNQDDRLILIEEYGFKGELCCECRSFSPHNLLVSFQKIYYTSLNDSFNGAVLFDSNSHPVMYKTYQIDSQTNAFTELLIEEWDLAKGLP